MVQARWLLLIGALWIAVGIFLLWVATGPPQGRPPSARHNPRGYKRWWAAHDSSDANMWFAFRFVGGGVVIIVLTCLFWYFDWLSF